MKNEIKNQILNPDKVKELYKFRSIPQDESELHYVERIFSANELYFPSPAELNDPFEFRPNIVVGDMGDSDYKEKNRQYIGISNGQKIPK